MDGEKRYILAPKNVKVGDRIQNGQGAEIRPGNALPMRYFDEAMEQAKAAIEAARK